MRVPTSVEINISALTFHGMASIFQHSIVIAFIVVMAMFIGLLLAVYHRDTYHRLPLLRRRLATEGCKLKCSEGFSLQAQVCQSDFVILIKLESRDELHNYYARHISELRVIKLQTYRIDVQFSKLVNLIDYRYVYVNGSINCLPITLKKHNEYLIAGKLDEEPIRERLRNYNHHHKYKLTKYQLALVINKCGLIINWTELNPSNRSLYQHELNAIKEECYAIDD